MLPKWWRSFAATPGLFKADNGGDLTLSSQTFQNLLSYSERNNVSASMLIDLIDR